MPRRSAEAAGDHRSGGYEEAGTVRLAYTERRWQLANLSTDDDGVVLNIVVQADGDSDAVRYRSVRIPLEVDGDDLAVGEAEIEQTPYEQETLL